MSSVKVPRGTSELSDCLVMPVVPRVQAKHHGGNRYIKLRAEGAGLLTPIRFTNDTVAGRSTRKVASRCRCFGCKTCARRARLQANQARYRKKQREERRTLEQSVTQLRQEVDCLTRARHAERERTANHTLVAGIFTWLETGFHYLERVASVQRAVVYPLSFFPYTACFTDATTEDLYGVDAVVAQLQSYLLHFADSRILLQGVRSVTEGVVEARAWINVTVSELTLQRLVPEPEDRDEVRDRLLGQRLHCKCVVNFLLDEAHRRVAQVSTRIDFIGPLLGELGGLGLALLH